MKDSKYDVFISYSRADYKKKGKLIPGNEVTKIREALDSAGIKCWFDEKISPGEDYAAKINRYIKLSRILVFLSSSSANKSAWTRKEISIALNNQKHIIPVRLDDTPFDSATETRLTDLQRIEYFQNPSEGIKDLIDAVKNHLDGVPDKIDEIEKEIAAEEKRNARLKDVVHIKERELESAKTDFEASKAKLERLQNRLQFDSNECGCLKGDAKKPMDELEFIVKGVRFKMIYVESGSFQMGADDIDSEACDDERPCHEVSLPAYYLGETVVTQELWYEVMGNNPSCFRGKNLPVECVCWDDPRHPEWSCQVFLRKLNIMIAEQLPSGRKFRLPKEAEWEYAARKGVASRNHCMVNLNNNAWYVDNSNGKTHPVKELNVKNDIGIFGMIGNVWEFCSDWYDSEYYEKSSAKEPEGPLTGYGHVYRGGSWESDAKRCRVTYRNYTAPATRCNNIGFRLAL